VRRAIAQCGGKTEIHSTATPKIQHAVDKALYAFRNRIERFFNRAKNSHRPRHPLRQADRELRRHRPACLHPIWIKFAHTT
jgi:hypothetical protein